MNAARKALLLCLALLVAIAAGCNNNNSGEAAEKDSSKPASANAPTAETAAQTNGEVAEKLEDFPNDLYPDFPFDQFSIEEKNQVVKLAKAELCPCPDSSASLHECMQDPEKRCDLAMQVQMMIGGMTKSAYNQTDILDAVAEFVEAAKRQHSFALEGRPHKGNPDAKVIVVEFADFECPYCKHASGLLADIVKKYGDNIALYYKNYPLPAHQWAELASRASVAAHRQGKFWPMHDELFKNQKSLGPAKIDGIAQRIGLNMAKFKQDLQSPEVMEHVTKDRADGESGGLTGTPTIFVNGRRYLGELTEDGLRAAIDKALRDAEKTDTTTNTTN